MWCCHIYIYIVLIKQFSVLLWNTAKFPLTHQGRSSQGLPRNAMKCLWEFFSGSLFPFIGRVVLFSSLVYEWSMHSVCTQKRLKRGGRKKTYVSLLWSGRGGARVKQQVLVFSDDWQATSGGAVRGGGGVCGGGGSEGAKRRRRERD